MADLEDAVPVEVEPDLSDLAIVTLNVETREGAQYTMVWAAEEKVLSVALDDVVEVGTEDAKMIMVRRTSP